MSKGAIDGAFPSIRGWLFMYRKVHVEESRTRDENSILVKGLRTKAIESRDFQGGFWSGISFVPKISRERERYFRNHI